MAERSPGIKLLLVGLVVLFVSFTRDTSPAQ